MTRTFYDAIHPANIPVTAQGVCGYIDGLYAWTAADWARFPRSVKARIAVFSATNDGHILDVEWGCSTPQNAPGWVAKRRKAGIDPSVYTSYGNLGQNWAIVINEFHRQGIAEPHWWIAAYPGNGPNLYPGSHAHQWQNPGPVDISVVADYWPGVDPKPVAPQPAPVRPTPQPAPPVPGKGLLDMFITYTKTQHYIVIGGAPHIIATQADEVAYKVAGVPVIILSPGELANYGVKP
jgi:hypothetical protein